MSDRLLTEAEAAEVLGMKEPTLRKWRNDRKIPFVRMGRSVRYRKDALDQFIADQTVESV